MKKSKNLKQKLVLFSLLVFMLFPIFLTGDIPMVMGAEEDEEDNFTSMPNYRWFNESTTNTDIEEQLISNDVYQISNTNLDPDDTAKIEKSRALNSRDLYFDTRFNMDIAGNETEYFRDEVGNEADFSDGLDGWVSSGATSFTSVDGIAIVETPGAFDGIRYYFSPYLSSMKVYNQIEIRIKAIRDTSMYFYTKGDLEQSLDASSQLTFWATTEWQTIQLDLLAVLQTDKDTQVSYLTLITLSGETSPSTIYIDYIKIFGVLDYATHADGEIEDTWDWEESVEYFYNEEDYFMDFNGVSEDYFTNEGDAVDFEEGDIDGASSTAGWVEEVDGWLNSTRNSPTSSEVYTSWIGLSIDASVYKYIAIKLEPMTNTLSHIQIIDADSNLVADDTGLSLTVNEIWFKIYNLSADADWTGTETSITIQCSMPGDAYNAVHFDWIYLTENQMDYSNGWQDQGMDNVLGIQNENLEVYDLTGRQAFFNITGLSIDASKYKWFTMAMRCEGREVSTFAVRDGDGNIVLNDGVAGEDTTNWFIFSYDLSLDADWTGTETGLSIYTYMESAGEFTLIIDFIALYDVEMGDIEIEEISNLEYHFVNPEGYLEAITDSTQTAIYIQHLGSPTYGTHYIDTSIFYIVKFRLRSADPNSLSFVVNGRTNNDEYIQYSENFIMSDGWVEYEIDIRDDSDYVEGELLKYYYIRIADYDGAGYFVDDQKFYLDYVLVLGEFDHSEGFKYSLLNRDHEEGVVFEFTKNDTETNLYNFTVDFMDNLGVALHYTEQFNYSLSDGWLDLSVELNLNKKRIRLRLEYENGTDIVYVRSLYDLYGSIGTPNLKILDIGYPRLCINGSLDPMSRYTVQIDYIDADWTILNWERPDETSPVLGQWALGGDATFDQSLDTDVLTHYTMDYEDDLGSTTTKTAWFMLDIDRFDGVSMDLSAEMVSPGQQDYGLIRIFVANVKTDGSLDVLLQYYNRHGTDGSSNEQVVYKYIWYEEDGTYHAGQEVNDIADINAESSISFYLDLQSNQLVAQAKCKVGGGTEIIGTNVSRTEPLTQEMVIFVVYEIFENLGNSGDDRWKSAIGGFDVVRKDLLGDLVAGILSPLLEGLTFLVSLFMIPIMWILSGLVKLGQAITDALSPVISAIATILTGVIQSATTVLDLAIGALETALSTAIGAVETAVGGIATALGALAEGIWTQLLSITASIVTFVEDILTLIIPMLTDLLNEYFTWLLGFYEDILNNLLFVVFDEIIAALGLTELITLMLSFFTDVLEVLGSIITLITVVMGFFFESAGFWLVPERFMAMALMALIVVAIWVFYPLFVLFTAFADGTMDIDLIFDVFEQLFSKILTVFGFMWSFISYVFEFMLSLLTTIGGFIPLT